MSRIDDALRRAGAAQTPFEERRGAVVLEPRTAAADPAGLERFTSEHHNPVVVLPDRAPENTKVRLVGPAPAIVRLPHRISVAPGQEVKLVVSPDMASFTLEQYRRLATVLNDMQVQRGVKTLMVSSAAPAEGKTHTITNLALTLSEAFQQKVLLIDADLRRPSLHQVFGVPVGAGLVDVICTPSLALPVVEISPHLCVLTAGRAGATPLAHLASDVLPRIISTAASQFDWVLIDTPPIGLLPDAQLVARICETVLFVVAAGVTPYAFVQRGIAALGADRIAGVVLNRADESNVSAGSYYSSSYNDYPALR
jgi:receptor protein-tyrosine kinase